MFKKGQAVTYRRLGGGTEPAKIVRSLGNNAFQLAMTDGTVRDAPAERIIAANASTFRIVNPKTNKVRALIDVPDKAGNEAQAMHRAATHYAKQITGDSKATAMICHGNPPGPTLFVPATGRHVHQKHTFRVRR